MTEQEQRIAIAEACGWENAAEKLERGLSVPDYLHDLNAMHEAEKTLSDEQQYEYFYTHLLGMFGGSQWSLLACTATAAQRAEAFLRTIGKWKGLTP